MLDEHSKRRAPVTDMVLANDGVADRLTHSHQCITDHGRSQVPDVHLFRHVRCGIVDDDSLGSGRTTDPEVLIVTHFAEQAGHVRIVEGEVEESGTGDPYVGTDARQIELVDELLSDVAWFLAELVRQSQGDIHLCVGSVARPRRRVEAVRRFWIQASDERVDALDNDVRGFHPFIVADSTRIASGATRANTPS